ncbi:MAG: imidazole glycerol phosphate synthase subunit HisH [Bacteroidales bacterium]|nr:imidazole glycerol phosphate synthase subunit HisH [Bacteroidales bacterium]
MIAIVDYDAGNVRSLINALRRVGVSEWELTSDPELLMSADRVLLPGVGDASVALASLRFLGLDSVIPSLKCPVLGICVGMQVMCRGSEEGDAVGLGIFDTDVVRFIPGDPSVKIPHMGWNSLTGLKSPLFDGLAEGTFMYFVHSYYAGICDCTVAASEHSVPFSAALCKDNFFGTQFHPEKSGSDGARLLHNFLSL